MDAPEPNLSNNDRMFAAWCGCFDIVKCSDKDLNVLDKKKIEQLVESKIAASHRLPTLENSYLPNNTKRFAQ
jgi:hypothetical protein